MTKKIPVFVYGSLKRGFHNHFLLEGSEFVAEALSCDRHAMWGKGFPFLVTRSRGHRVAGEIYLVDKETLASLDRLEGHPRLYRRTWRMFKVGRTRRRAWIYLTPSDRYNSREVALDEVATGRDGILRWADPDL